MSDPVNKAISEAVHAAVYEFTRKQRISQEWLAERCGVEPSTFSNYLHGARPVPASLIVRLTDIVGYTLIADLSRQCGGVFMLTGSREFGTDSKAYERAVKFVQTSGETATVVLKALRDDKLTPKERRDCNRWLSKHTEAIALLQQAIEEMPVTDKDGDDE